MSVILAGAESARQNARNLRLVRFTLITPISQGCTCYWEMGQIWGDDPNCPMHAEPVLADEYNFG